MKKLLLLLWLFLCFTFIASTQSSRKIHDKAIVVDAHNDVLSESVLEGVDISNRVTQGHSDLVRWKEGGLDVQFFSVWTGDKARNKEGFFKDALQEIDSLGILILKNLHRMTLARRYKEVKRGIRQDKLVALIGVEGGHMIENDLGKLQDLYNQGMRYLTLTWNNSTSWATSAKDETEGAGNLAHKGLTDFGREVVRKLNELGVIVDLSHVGEQTFYDAIAVTTKPVILSHSSVWSICPVFRNVKDDQIKAVAKNGGVICINFYSGFISKGYDARADYLMGPGRKRIMDSLTRVHTDSTPVHHDTTVHTSVDSAKLRTEWRKYFRAEMKKLQPTLAQLADHIDYIVKLVGDDYVGIGSDFDGVSALPAGMDDVTSYPKLTGELMRRGYTTKSIYKILGGNVMRVMRANFR
jgi:membrane dipeptidase